MSKCFGIVAEFNPFHNGHAALLRFARQNGADYIAAVMSGNAVQRGSFAVTDKRIRAKAALLCGCDIVIELPIAYSLASARPFASGAISLLKSTGFVDAVCFGSENGDAAELEKLSILADAPETEKEMLAKLSAGVTFARARQEAFAKLYGQEAAMQISSPNNILALEYLRAMRHLAWDAEVLTMKRTGTDHDSAVAGDEFASASYLRGNLGRLSTFVPAKAMEVYSAAMESGLFPADEAKLETAILSHFRRTTRDDLAALPDISEGIENRLYKAARQATSLNGFMMTAKTKRYTLARIRRLVLSSFLGITAADAKTPIPYIRVLGFNDKGRELLAKAKDKAMLPVHTSLAVLEKQNEACGRFAYLEAGATDQHSLALPETLACGYEYTANAVYSKTIKKTKNLK